MVVIQVEMDVHFLHFVIKPFFLCHFHALVMRRMRVVRVYVCVCGCEWASSPPRPPLWFSFLNQGPSSYVLVNNLLLLPRPLLVVVVLLL